MDDEDDELQEPLSATDAKRMARTVMRTGELTFSKHARERMEEREFQSTDVTNVLRGGTVDDVHFESGSWRYRFNTRTMQVVVVFLGPTTCVVVTVMRTS